MVFWISWRTLYRGSMRHTIVRRIEEFGSMVPVYMDNYLGWSLIVNVDVLEGILKRLDNRGDAHARNLIRNDVEKQWSETILEVLNREVVLMLMFIILMIKLQIKDFCDYENGCRLVIIGELLVGGGLVIWNLILKVLLI